MPFSDGLTVQLSRAPTILKSLVANDRFDALVARDLADSERRLHALNA
jgi:hypothetical protein